VSQPPEYPGRHRLKRVAAAAGSDAYQGAFEAIGSVLIACAFGYWIDSRWDTKPYGMLIGTVVGFGALVLGFIRVGKEQYPDAVGSDSTDSEKSAARGVGDLNVGEAPGMSSVLRDDAEDADDMGDVGRDGDVQEDENGMTE
jgi:F0F1-type ATP synthase assembly protein I